MDPNWHLDVAVQLFCSKGLADSTHKTYQSALKKFNIFCSIYGILIPFPVSEAILCYFVTYLARQNLSPQTIKTHLEGVRNTQIILGLPEPRAFSPLPHLQLVQIGVQRTFLQILPVSKKIRLPITPKVIRKIRALWSTQIGTNPDISMLPAATRPTTMCFFGFSLQLW